MSIINANVGSAAVGAAGNLFSGLINAFTQKRAQKRQHNYNLELQENAHEMAMEQQEQASMLQQQNWETQFNMQNEYNSPESQLQRLKDAGLNPLFSGDMANSNSMSAAASAPSASVPAPSDGLPNMQPFSSLGSDAVNMYTALSENSRKEERHQADINKTFAETDKLIAETANIDVNTDVGRAKIQEINANIEKLYADTQATYERTQLATKEYLANLFFQEWELSLKERQVKTQETLSESQIELQDAQAYQALAGGQAALMSASAAEQQAETLQSRLEHDQKEAQRRYDLDKDKFKQDIKNANFDQINKLLQNATSSIYGLKYYKSSEVIGLYQAFSEYFQEGTVGGMDQTDNYGTEFNRLKLFHEVGKVIENMQQRKTYNRGRY